MPKGNLALACITRTGTIEMRGLGCLTLGKIDSGNNATNNGGLYIGPNTAGSIAGGHASGSGKIRAGYSESPFSYPATGAIAMGYAATGKNITATKYGSIAIGSASNGDVEAKGDYAFAQGDNVHATQTGAYARGYNVTSSGFRSFAQGIGLKASANDQVVFGKYNVEDSAGTYTFIIGNGTSDSARSNAVTVDTTGTITAGNLNVTAATVTSISASTLTVGGSAVQEKLSAGNGIDITGSTISCTVSDISWYNVADIEAMTTAERQDLFTEILNKFNNNKYVVLKYTGTDNIDFVLSECNSTRLVFIRIPFTNASTQTQN